MYRLKYKVYGLEYEVYRLKHEVYWLKHEGSNGLEHNGSVWIRTWWKCMD